MSEFLRSFARRDRWSGLWRSSFLRWTVAGTLAFLVFVKFALPLFVSTSLVKDNMEAALSRWTGARATIGGTASVNFWPGPTLTLADIRFETQKGAAPFATAKAITADFDLLAALSGNPVFYDFHLLEPTLTVRRGKDGQSNWPIPQWMNAAIAAQTRPQTAPARGEPIGDIVIDKGTIDIRDEQRGNGGRLENINGTIAWSSPTARLSADLGAIVNGEPININLAVDSPMAFLAGKESGLRGAFGSGPLQINFDGRGNGGRYPGLNGDLQLTAPSLPDLTRWLGAEAAASSTQTPLSIETTISTAISDIKMDNLVLSIGDANATGLLDITLRPGSRPKLNGSLAFDRLQVEMLTALSPMIGREHGEQHSLLRDQFDIDLRLSAQTASYGPFALSDLAAGIMSNGERISIDIGDSNYAGGGLNGRITLIDSGAKGAEMAVSLKNADFGTLLQRLGADGPTLQGEGVLSLDLATTKPLNAMTINDVLGKIHFSGGRGVLTRFDADTFETLVAQGQFFDSSAVNDGTFPTQSAEIIARLQEGVATIEKAEIRGEQKTLILTGVVPFRTNGLALAGSLTSNDASAPAARFFAGGSWPDAVISPLSTLPSQP